jgi:lysozyme family protein
MYQILITTTVMGVSFRGENVTCSSAQQLVEFSDSETAKRVCKEINSKAKNSIVADMMGGQYTKGTFEVEKSAVCLF